MNFRGKKYFGISLKKRNYYIYNLLNINMALNTYSTLSRYPLNIIRGTRRGPDRERATFTVGATADKNVPKYIVN